MKKTKKYEKFYKCENSSSKNIDSEIEDFTIENPIVNACYFGRFLPAHFVGNFAWFSCICKGTFHACSKGKFECSKELFMHLQNFPYF